MSDREDVRLRSYLLGRLGEEEAEALEKEYFTDPERRERLAVEEDELFDAYAAGGLSSDDRRTFEAKYLSSEEGRNRAELAAALRERVVARPVVQRPARPLPWRWLAAAAVLASVGLSGWSLYRQRRAEDELRQVRQAVQDLSHRDAELRRLLDARAFPPGPTATDSSPAPAGPPPGVVALVLAPGLQRDGGPAPTMRLRPDTRSVRLRLRVKREWEYAAYEARVESADGRELARVRPTPAQMVPEGRVVDVVVPASSLADGTCIVMLQGRTSRSLDDLASYVFHVTRGD